MKILKYTEIVLFVLSVLQALIAFFLPSNSNGTGSLLALGMTFFVVGAGFFILVYCVGAVLHFSRNNVARAVGNGFLLTIVPILLIYGAMNLENGSQFILCFISSIFMILSFLVKWFGMILTSLKLIPNEQNSDDPEIKTLLKLKSMLKQELITKEEYEEKRKAIVGSINNK